MTTKNLEASKTRGLGLIIAQAGPDRRRVVWGPASVEMESRDGKIITMSAIEAALPQLMRRRALSVLHKDQLVGEIHEAIEIPPLTAASSRAERLATELGGVFRTALYTVTQAIADAFPKLRPFIGTEQFFVAATVYGDNSTSDLAWREVTEGKLDSFSISGAATETQSVERQGPDGKRVLERVTEMDLSAVTLASSSDEKRGTLTATARNPAAALLVIAQSEAPTMTTTPATTQQADGADATAPGADQVTDALAELARRVGALETRFAEREGAEAQNPQDAEPAAQAPPAKDEEAKPGEEPDEAEKPADSKENPRAEDDAEDDQDQEKKKMKPVAQANPPTPAPAPAPAPVEQAQPAATEAPKNDLAQMLEQAVAKALAPVTARLDAIEQSTKAADMKAGSPPTPAPAPATARPSTVQTPAPSAPSQGAPTGPTNALAMLVEAADTGDNVAFREAMQTHGPTAFPNLKIRGE